MYNILHFIDSTFCLTQVDNVVTYTLLLKNVIIIYFYL